MDGATRPVSPVRLELTIYSSLGGGPGVIVHLPGGDRVSLPGRAESPLGLRLAFLIAKRLSVAAGLLFLNPICMADRDLRRPFFRQCVEAGYSLDGLPPEDRAEAEGAVR